MTAGIPSDGNTQYSIGTTGFNINVGNVGPGQETTSIDKQNQPNTAKDTEDEQMELQTRFEEVKEQIAAVKEQLTPIDGEIKTQEGLYDKIMKQINVFKSSKKKSSADDESLSKLSKQAEDVKSVIDKLKNKKADLEEKRNKLTEELAEIENEQEAFEEELRTEPQKAQKAQKK